MMKRNASPRRVCNAKYMRDPQIEFNRVELVSIGRE